MNQQSFLQQPSQQGNSRKRPQSPTEATPCKRLVTESMVASKLKRLSLEPETSHSSVDNGNKSIVSFSDSPFVSSTPSAGTPSRSLIRQDTPHPEKWARMLENEGMKKSMEIIEVKEDSDNEADVSDLEESNKEEDNTESVNLPMEYRLGEKKGRVPRFLLRSPRSLEQAILDSIPERSLILYKPFTWGSILKVSRQTLLFSSESNSRLSSSLSAYILLNLCALACIQGILPPASSLEKPGNPTSKVSLETGVVAETGSNITVPEEEDMDVDMELDDCGASLEPEMAPAGIEKQVYMDL